MIFSVPVIATGSTGAPEQTRDGSPLGVGAARPVLRAAAARFRRGPRRRQEEEEKAPKEKEEKSEEEEAPKKSGKKVKGGSTDVEEESTKHAVVVSAKAKLSGNIKEAEDSGSESKDGKKTIVTATAKHNRETVLEQSVPIHHVGSVEKVEAPPSQEEAKETKDGMKKPTVVARGSLVQ